MIPLLLSSLVFSAGACPTEPRTADGVQTAEQRWVTALEQRNTRALDCILDPSFVDTSWRGELLTKAEALSALRKRTSSTLELSALQPKLIGDVAIMRGIDTQKSAGRIIGSVRFVDVFVYRSGRWQAVLAQETLIATSP